MKKILIISGSYPNYGGQSTTAYNLLKLLKDKNYSAKLVYVNYHKEDRVFAQNSTKEKLHQHFVQLVQEQCKCTIGRRRAKGEELLFLLQAITSLQIFSVIQGLSSGSGHHQHTILLLAGAKDIPQQETAFCYRQQPGDDNAI
jgi:hypothetical protein